MQCGDGLTPAGRPQVEIHGAPASVKSVYKEFGADAFEGPLPLPPDRVFFKTLSRYVV